MTNEFDLPPKEPLVFCNVIIPADTAAQSIIDLGAGLELIHPMRGEREANTITGSVLAAFPAQSGTWDIWKRGEDPCGELRENYNAILEEYQNEIEAHNTLDLEHATLKAAARAVCDRYPNVTGAEIDALREMVK